MSFKSCPKINENKFFLFCFFYLFIYFILFFFHRKHNGKVHESCKIQQFCQNMFLFQISLNINHANMQARMKTGLSNICLNAILSDVYSQISINKTTGNDFQKIPYFYNFVKSQLVRTLPERCFVISFAVIISLSVSV